VRTFVFTVILPSITSNGQYIANVFSDYFVVFLLRGGAFLLKTVHYAYLFDHLLECGANDFLNSIPLS